MKKNDILEGTCIDYTHEGLGIVKANDFIFFIKGVLRNEKIRFIVTKLNKTYGYGKCIEIVSASKQRMAPVCLYYGKCGGCHLQHMTLKEQMYFKTNIVRNNMERIGNIKTEVLDCIGMNDGFAYRNKAQFPVTLQNGVRLGFYRMFSNDIIDMNQCMIQSDVINHVMQFVKGYFETHSFKDVFRHLLIKHAFATNEVMVVFIVRENNIKGLNELVGALVEKFACIKSVILNVNTRNDNVILGEKEYVLYGKKHIVDELNGVKFLISSKSFYQVNPVQTEVLYNTVLKFANINQEDTVIDLYCGVGTITLFVSRQAKKVIGIEIVEAAIEDAKLNAKMNAIENVEFVCSDAGKYASYLASNKMHPDVVIVDPPRKGCDEKTIQSILTMSPNRIVYVSCNPSTLARDLKKFEANGYETVIVQPIDLFPNTFHVESVVLLTKVHN